MKRINIFMHRLYYWFKNLLDDIKYWFTTVEVCPRERTKDGKPTGWYCRGNSRCLATHYRVPRK